MDNLTAEQLRECATGYIQTSSLLKKIARTFEISDPAQFNRLMALAEAILVEAIELIDKAIAVAVKDAKDAADRLERSTETVRNTLNTINEIARILNIAAAVLNLVTAFTTGIASGSAIVTIGSSLKAVEDLTDTLAT